uniref:Uncharacterized protein n=1 Tax=Astyanax mexicanus TaxID=7994 RepID=A0A3B1KDA9_ASTMX
MIEPRSSRPAWATYYKKLGWVWWHGPVVPATREAEVGRIHSFQVWHTGSPLTPSCRLVKKVPASPSPSAMIVSFRNCKFN